MSEEVNDEGLRKYLLGELPESEQQALEERLMTETELFALIPVIEDELIDDYLGGLLSSDERGRFESFFVSTPERRRKLSFAMALRRYITAEGEAVEAPATEPATTKPSPRIAAGQSSVIGGATWWNRAFSSPYLRIAAAAVIVLGLGLGIWRVFFYQSEVDKGITALARAYRHERPVEARISGLGYAPSLVTRGDEQQTVDLSARDRAERILLDEVERNPGSPAFHALGRLFLAEHKFDRAIHEFEQSLKGDPNNAQLHSDLGVAYLELAVTDHEKPNIGYLAKSLELVNRALEIDSSLLAAHFNKALCLQRMNALTMAKEAWENYLKRDADSDWSREAERNLHLLQNQGANNTPEEVFLGFMAACRQRDEARAWRIQSQTKEMITGTMIPFQLAQRLVDASLSNETEAGKEISGALRFVGELEKVHSGDPFFADLAEFYAVARNQNSATLRQAQNDLQQGYQLCLQGRYSDAMLLFGKAQNLFLQVGDTWESKIVDYWSAYCLSQQGKLNRSNELLSALAEYSQRRNYYWLEGQAYCWLANNSVLLGEYSRGMEQDKKALGIALSIGDLYNTQRTSSQLAKGYKIVGRPETALEYHRLSLPSADAYYFSPRQYWRSLNSLTDTLFAIRLYAAAEAYEREALELAVNQLNDPVLIHNTYLRLGQIYSGQQNYPAAERSLELSLETIKKIGQDFATRKLFGQSGLQMGNVRRVIKDYASALNYYRDALQMFDSTDVSIFNYVAHKGMLLCYLHNRDDSAVRRELPTVLDLFERNRQRIKEEQNRNHFFDAEQDVYDLAIDYEYTQGNTEGSFNYAEFSRARSLLDEIIRDMTPGNDHASTDIVASAASRPLTLAQLQERLPAGLQLVEYAVLESRLLIWIVTKTGVAVLEQPVSFSTLEAATNEYLSVLPRSDADSIEREHQLAIQLYDWLFAPIEGYLGKAEEVALVPDKFLFKIPFAALFSRETGQHVINDYTLLYAPSATVLVFCSDLARTKGQHKEAERLLSVGDPEFNRQAHPNLLPLPKASDEAKKIASFYLASAVFIRGEAVKEQVELKFDWADVIHFAGHYLVDDFSSAKSRLVLAARPGAGITDGSDDLSLEEIQIKRLPRAKVAILAACKSGIERYYAGEGLVGLSRAFIMAGVPLVVASQWAVESDSTSQLMIDFHKLRRMQNLSTTAALRRAQLDMMSQEDERYHRPYFWAGFFPVGGYASF